jgi:PBP1b-binding outer membrane lipoprotein LpoB
MSVKRILAGILGALLLAACSSSPSAPSEQRLDTERVLTNTSTSDSTQASARAGNFFGSGT